ncbi:MAG: prepilin peptidase [Lachnospiraceae bacterium]|nr:prepilin peptidase [Lachnospiraceae bacterium]
MIIITVTVFLAICAYTDIKERVIHIHVLLPFLAAGIIYAAYSGGNTLLTAAAGAACGVFLLILSFFTKGAIGEGDGLALAVTGVYLGFSANISLILTGLFLSAAASVITVLFKGWKKDREIPFMPFLLTAFVLIKIGEKL